jgi:hypothetical protein
VSKIALKSKNMRGLFRVCGLRLPQCTLRFRDGSNASVELAWHVGFTPDFGRMVATRELTLRARNGHRCGRISNLHDVSEIALLRAKLHFSAQLREGACHESR